MRSTQPTRRLGELLRARGVITQGQLEHALAQQRLTGEFLGTLLLKLGAVTEQQLLEAFSEQFGIPCEHLEFDQVDWSLAKQLAPSALEGGKCFPIRATPTAVTVAIINPLDAWALSAMEKAAGMRTVKPVLVLERDLQAVLKEHRRQTLQLLAQRLTKPT